MASFLIVLVTGFALGWFANVKININHTHKYDNDSPQEGYNQSFGDPTVRQYFDVKHGGDE